MENKKSEIFFYGSHLSLPTINVDSNEGKATKVPVKPLADSSNKFDCDFTGIVRGKIDFWENKAREAAIDYKKIKPSKLSKCRESTSIFESEVYSSSVESSGFDLLSFEILTPTESTSYSESTTSDAASESSDTESISSEIYIPSRGWRTTQGARNKSIGIICSSPRNNSDEHMKEVEKQFCNLSDITPNGTENIDGDGLEVSQLVQDISISNVANHVGITREESKLDCPTTKQKILKNIHQTLKDYTSEIIIGHILLGIVSTILYKPSITELSQLPSLLPNMH